ncbi:KAP family NTPase [Mesorhizobium sp. M0854]|uniref:P-loop NTPase fold protein n=1 Tax=Mesorhizobium sp. M0854 TaxID=2957013 RepID=UPI0033361C4F
MAINQIKREILIDEPSREDQFHGKGHERTAEALASAITNFRGDDRAIGLDGPWGSGKSTVVEIARRKLTEKGTRGGVHHSFFTFDIWQSQGSSFRRSFLEHFLDWARATFPKEDSLLEEIERKVKGKVREIQSTNRSMLDWYGICVVLLIPLLPVYYFWAKSAFDAGAFLRSWPFIFMLAFLAVAFCRAWWRFGHSHDRISFRDALSQTLLISAKQYEDQKITQHIRETDPNDFEFQSTLREILSVIQSDKSRVIIVLDNIDRLPKKEINEYWALVRAVFSRGPLSRNSGAKNPVTAIVPYDRRLIEGGYRIREEKHDKRKPQSEISSLSNREIFSKTFDEILVVAPPVMSNSREFFHEKINKALPDITETDDLFRVYLIFNRILKNENGNATPRQVIAFINELTGMYVLHEGRFGLPTVAVYIAYQDALEEAPDALNQPSFVDDRLRALAADLDLDRNLAAMIFNVEPNLAFQLLLDERIKSAAVQGSSELIEVSKSPGFDLRVSDVVENNVKEWQTSGEFGAVVSNFADLAAVYSGDATRHFSRSIVSAFRDLRLVDLSERRYTPLFRVFDMCTVDELPVLTSRILKCGLASLDGKDLGIEMGRNWATFIGGIRRALESKEREKVLGESMSALPPPSEPNFLFGVAANVADVKLSLALFKPGKLDLPAGEPLLETLAVDYPDAARKAFSEFKSTSLLKDEAWVSIANALRGPLLAVDVTEFDDYKSQMDLLAEIVTYLPSARRDDVDIASLFGSAEFYKNIGQGISENKGDVALASTVFLAFLSYRSAGLPMPTRRAANGQRIQENSEEYAWFKGIFDGGAELTDDQYIRVATLAKNARVISDWLGIASSAPDDQLLRSIIRVAFVSGNLPSINLANLLKYYGVVALSVGDEIQSVLNRFDSQIRDEEISKVKLDECPVEVVRASFQSDGVRWRLFHQRIADLLTGVPANEWSTHLAGGDHVARTLLEKISTSGYVSLDPAFRVAFSEFVLGVLAGRVVIVDAALDYDLLLDAIDKDFHSDIFRKLREDLKDVTTTTLTVATAAFPRIMDQLLNVGERISRQEKDNLIRYILCAALEADNRKILRGFAGLGRTKVADFIRHSEESTREKVKGAWGVFSNSGSDRDWSRQIGELLHGKRKAKSLFDIIWGTGRDDEEEAA